MCVSGIGTRRATSAYKNPGPRERPSARPTRTSSAPKDQAPWLFRAWRWVFFSNPKSANFGRATNIISPSLIIIRIFFFLLPFSYDSLCNFELRRFLFSLSSFSSTIKNKIDDEKCDTKRQFARDMCYSKTGFSFFFFSVGSHTAPIGEAITRGLIDSRQGNRSASRSGSPWHIRASSCNRTTGRNSLTPWPITRVGLKSPFECFASVSGLMERARLGSVPLGLGSPRSIQNSPTRFRAFPTL